MARRAGRYVTLLEGGAAAPVGSPEGIRFADAGNALSLTSGLYDINAAYTVAGWVRSPSAEEHPPLYAASDASENRWELLKLVNNALYAETGTPSDDDSASGDVLTWAATWRHVAFVRASTTVVIAYVDGVQAFTISGIDVAESLSAAYVTLGNFSPTSGNAVIGTDFALWRVWAAALDATELAAEKASATPVKTSGLRADWRMAGDNEAARLADSSGNNRTLTRSGTETGTFTDGPL